MKRIYEISISYTTPVNTEVRVLAESEEEAIAAAIKHWGENTREYDLEPTYGCETEFEAYSICDEDADNNPEGYDFVAEPVEPKPVKQKKGGAKSKSVAK